MKTRQIFAAGNSFPAYKIESDGPTRKQQGATKKFQKNNSGRTKTVYRGSKIGKRQQGYERCLASAAKLESSAMAAIGRRDGKG
jgi:hypothetical protein